MFSQNPTDRLIREIIQGGREATTEEIRQIRSRIAAAPFDRQMVTPREKERGLAYQGITFGASPLPSLEYHLVKRVVTENAEQWAPGTTSEQYLEDLRQAARTTSSRLGLFVRRGGDIAAVVAPSADVVPASRRGRDSLPNLLVIYSADRGIIVTGYQFSKWEAISVPEGVRWFR